MKAKILNLGLILTSFLGYLEWGTDNSMFLIQGEMEVISKLFSDPQSVIHPFILLPLAGQLLLLFTLFQRKPSKILTYLGLMGIGILLVFIFAISLISLNVKTIASTLPFIVNGVLVILEQRKK